MAPVFYRTVNLLPALALAIGASGCVNAPLSPLETSDEVYNASSRAITLQSIRAGDTEPLQDSLVAWMAGDIKVLGARLAPESTSPLHGDRRNSALQTLVVLAILNEKTPVAQWNGDAEVARILNWALAQNPQLTASIKNRNWSQSFLRRQ